MQVSSQLVDSNFSKITNKLGLGRSEIQSHLYSFSLDTQLKELAG